MAVPKKKTSRARRNQRRAHDAISAPGLVACPNCGEPHVPHRVCRECGYKLTREDEEAFESPDVDSTRDKILDLAIEASPMEKPSYTGEDDGFDVMARLTATETLGERVGAIRFAPDGSSTGGWIEAATCRATMPPAEAPTGPAGRRRTTS